MKREQFLQDYNLSNNWEVLEYDDCNPPPPKYSLLAGGIEKREKLKLKGVYIYKFVNLLRGAYLNNFYFL